MNRARIDLNPDRRCGSSSKSLTAERFVTLRRAGAPAVRLDTCAHDAACPRRFDAMAGFDITR